MRVAIPSGLFARVFIVTAAAILLLFAAMYFLSVPFIQATVASAEEHTAKTMLDDVFESVEAIHRRLEESRLSLLQERKRELRSVVEIVASRVNWLDGQVKAGRLPRAKAKAMLLDELRQLTYGKKDYVWAANYRSVLVSHPDPKLNGADFSKQRDVRGNLIVPPMVEGALAHGEGFHSYWWRRLGEQTPIEKLSYFRHFPAFGLVIGTGVYIDDIENALRRERAAAIEELRQRLHRTRLAKTGYLYVFDDDSVIIHPNATIEGKNLADVIDPVSGRPITQLLKTVADKPAGLRYKWDRPNDPGHFVYEKISWVRHSPGLGWYICSSIYVDELDESALTLRNRMLLVFALTLTLALVLVYFFIRRLTEPLRRMSETAKRVESGDLDARCALRRDDEIGVVAAAFDGMVDQLQDNIEHLDARVEARTAEREKAYAERAEAEIKLVESEDYNKMLFQESLQPMAVLDPLTGGLVDCNMAAAKLFGYAGCGDMMGTAAADRSPPTQYDGTDSRAAAKDHILLAQEHGGRKFEWRYQRTDGEAFDAMVHLMPFNYRGQPLMQLVIEDITEQRQAEEERRKLDQLKTDFLSTVSHELRTPMTSVIGFAKLVKKKLEAVVFPKVVGDEKTARTISQVSDNIDVIVKESERLTLLINDVLDSAKLEAGKVEWQFAPLPPAQLIAKAVAVTAHLAEQKGVRLTWQAAPDLPEVTADEGRMQQVLLNLISNAIKFTPQGVIALAAVRAGGFVRFSVRDSGIGIPAEHLDNVFSKFRQVTDTLTDKPPGTGLGLAICRQIIESHGGRIWAESTLGQGSVFSFYLPVAIAPTLGTNGH